jgi:hypothetical protein
MEQTHPDRRQDIARQKPPKPLHSLAQLGRFVDGCRQIKHRREDSGCSLVLYVGFSPIQENRAAKLIQHGYQFQLIDLLKTFLFQSQTPLFQFARIILPLTMQMQE